MLDFDIAVLYEVENRVLNQAVKTKIRRFNLDFMFQLNKKEWETLMSQFVISKTEKRGGTTKLPFAFTEQGLAMLSGILNSKKAISVNIAIMRAFVLIRQYALNYKELTGKLKEIEGNFADVYEAINYLLNKDKLQTEQNQRKRIGFKTEKQDMAPDEQ
jgi:hypothetical protein